MQCLPQFPNRRILLACPLFKFYLNEVKEFLTHGKVWSCQGEHIVGKPLQQHFDILGTGDQSGFLAVGLHLLNSQLLSHIAFQLSLGNLLFQFDSMGGGSLRLAS